MTIFLISKGRPLGLLLLLWWWGSSPVLAQPSRYWEANPDSLLRVLARQRPDTARLRTLVHLMDVGYDESKFAELVALTAKLRRPDHRGYRLQAAGERLSDARPAAALDSLQAAVEAFDRLGRPVPVLLGSIRLLHNTLNQQEQKRVYYQTKLAHYRRRGAALNMGTCHHALAGYFMYEGDYNQAIGHYLQARDLLRPYYPSSHHGSLRTVGAAYAQWGNYAKALDYLHQALRAPPSRYKYVSWLHRDIARVHLRQHRYAAALRVSDQALAPAPLDTLYRAYDKAFALVLKGAVLVALKRAAEAGPLLRRAEHLADSLRLPLTGALGNFELDAAWARYFAARGEGAKAAVAWRTAYRKARAGRSTPLRLDYLRELAYFHAARGETAPAARYALAAVRLGDSLQRRQGALHVARYEIEQADRAQNERIAALRRAQRQAAARAGRQRQALLAVLGGALLLGGVAAALYYAFRRSERLKQLVTVQKQDLQSQRDQLEASLTTLRATQAQLIQREKMASLGELTAGIAHEIQNPLNFVTNFSEVSTELCQEAQALLATTSWPAAEKEALRDVLADLDQNQVKITQHGQRAAGIVRSMLEHSRASTGEREPTNLNRLCDEYLRLAYQGLRAKDQGFNATLKTDFAPDLPLVSVVGTDLSRVLLNLFTNAFYAVRQRQQQGEPGYQPQVGVRTLLLNQQVQVQVTDNGPGMSEAVQQKIFQPFFTTKPSGEGTGLGLSLAHGIVVQGHGGTLAVESQEGQGTTFSVELPLHGPA